MPEIQDKHKFIEELKKFTELNSEINLVSSFTSNQILINETSDEGAGEIYLDISTYTNLNIFFVKINHLSRHTIGTCNNHNDGIVLKIDLNTNRIEVLLFELKKQLRLNKLEKAMKQQSNAYKFIKYLQLEECFHVDYRLYIVYKDNNISRDIDKLKITDNKYIHGIFNAIYRKKNTIPLQIPFCQYLECKLEQVEFGETITI
jgi:hypothetical protein